MERRLGESVGWMLDLFVAGRWIPFLLCRQCRRAQEMRVIIDEGREGGRKDGRDTGRHKMLISKTTERKSVSCVQLANEVGDGGNIL